MDVNLIIQGVPKLTHNLILSRRHVLREQRACRVNMRKSEGRKREEKHQLKFTTNILGRYTTCRPKKKNKYVWRGEPEDTLFWLSREAGDMRYQFLSPPIGCLCVCSDETSSEFERILTAVRIWPSPPIYIVSYAIRFFHHSQPVLLLSSDGFTAHLLHTICTDATTSWERITKANFITVPFYPHLYFW